MKSSFSVMFGLCVAVSLSLACAGLELQPAEDVSALPPGDISSLSGYNVWVLVDAKSPSKDYCGMLRQAGMTVECNYGWDIYDDETNVMLKCATLPANTGATLQRYLELPSLQIWDWRNHPDYGMPYCGEMGAITIEIIEG